MLREDGSFVFYKIEERQSRWDRWVELRDNYLKEYEFGKYFANGDCWQKLGENGVFDLEYAKKYCNDLNCALLDGSIHIPDSRDVLITRFRIIQCEVAQSRTPLESVMY